MTLFKEQDFLAQVRTAEKPGLTCKKAQYFIAQVQQILTVY